MVRLLSFLMCVSFVLASAPHTVSELDIESYTGKWFQIADYPQFYESFCKSCTTAEYTLNSDKTIDVVNTCRKSPSAGNTSVHAKGKIPDASQPGKLSVTFFGLFPAQYWIVALGPKNAENLYSWALVSNGDRSSCYILSRIPALPSSVQDMVFLAMAKNGIDNSTKKLKFTDQTGCGWDDDELAVATEPHPQPPLIGGPESLHASCKMTFVFPNTGCNEVINGLSVAAKEMHGLATCGKDPVNNLCGYTETGATTSSWKGTHMTANGKYTDDLTFTLSASGSGCTAAAYSTSETWYAVLDNGVNYCNLHNLVAHMNVTANETPAPSDSTCTQYSKRNCARY